MNVGKNVFMNEKLDKYHFNDSQWILASAQSFLYFMQSTIQTNLISNYILMLKYNTFSFDYQQLHFHGIFAKKFVAIYLNLKENARKYSQTINDEKLMKMPLFAYVTTQNDLKCNVISCLLQPNVYGKRNRLPILVSYEWEACR